MELLFLYILQTFFIQWLSYLWFPYTINIFACFLIGIIGSVIGKMIADELFSFFIKAVTILSIIYQLLIWTGNASPHFISF